MAKDIPFVRHARLELPFSSIRLDSPEWFAWLDDPANTRFSYAIHNRTRGYIDGFMTVRKERRQRGGVYWSVYRRRKKRLRKIYVGASTALTFDKLEEIVLRLRDPPEE